MHYNCHIRLLIASALMAWLTSAPAMGGPIGTNFPVSQTGGAFPDVAYSTGSDRYLVAYGHARVRGRLVTPTGQVSGSEFYISDPYDPTKEGGGLFPDVAYNAANDEFLVVWDDQRIPPAGQAASAAWGQRIRASDGARLGINFPIGDSDSFAVSVAWSPINNTYLVVWRAGGTTRGRWVRGDGTLNGSAFSISSSDYLYPNVAFGATSFLVTWDCDCGTAVGRCLAPGSTQAGSLIPITGASTGWRTAAAFDPGAGAQPARWLVQFTHYGMFQDSDQFGAFVSSQGSADGVIFPIAEQSSHEGDTNFGAAIAFIPSPPRYMSIFQASGTSANGVGWSGTSVQELDRDGQPRGGQNFISSGDELGQAVAGDPEAGRFLNCWYSRQDSTVYARLYEPIKPVTQLTGIPANRSVRLSWTNPSTADFTATIIRYKTNGYPTGPNDGYVAVEQPGAPGSVGTFTHRGLADSVTVYYAAYAKDSGPHTSDPTTLAVMPALSADFDKDQDVDQSDFGHLQVCLTGEGQTTSAGCQDADLDVDDDVDASDVVTFTRCFNGPSRPPGC